jgi:hypothetical protein
MTWCAKDIKDGVVEILGNSDSEVLGYMDGVDSQARIKFRLNREKLGYLLYEVFQPLGMRVQEQLEKDFKENSVDDDIIKLKALILADVILAADKEIVEVDKDL